MNVLVVVLDALRFDHTSLSGYHRDTTPNIAAIAADGVSYESAYTPATWTRPTSVSLLTGLWPLTHQVRSRTDHFPSCPRLPEILSDHGFETVGISSMVNVSTTYGHDGGFDRFYDLWADEDLFEQRATNHVQALSEIPDEVASPTMGDISDTLSEWFDSRSDSEPFFAFCWAIDPHRPYDPPEAFDRYTESDEEFKDITPQTVDYFRDRYDDAIAYADAQIGSVVEELEERNLYDETMICVLGDHGEGFLEHGHSGWGYSHGHDPPYQEFTNVPLVLKPGNDPQSLPNTVDTTVSLVDLPTTIASLAADVEPAWSQGRLLRPFGDEPREYVVSETEMTQDDPTYYAVWADDWKYICSEATLLDTSQKEYAEMWSPRALYGRIRELLGAGSSSITDELFELSTDPKETEDLSGTEYGSRDRLRAILKDWHSQCVHQRDQFETSVVRSESDVPDQVEAQLEHLGYK